MTPKIQINYKNQCLGPCDIWIKRETWASSHIDGVFTLTSSISSVLFYLELVSLLSRQPEIVLQYELKFWIGQCIGYRYLRQYWDLWVAGNERFSQTMNPPKQVLKVLFSNRFFHKPVRNDCTLRIDRRSHEEFKTVIVDDLAALEAGIQPFQWFRPQRGPFSDNQTSCGTFGFVINKTELMPTFFTITPLYP